MLLWNEARCVTKHSRQLMDVSAAAKHQANVLPKTALGWMAFLLKFMNPGNTGMCGFSCLDHLISWRFKSMKPTKTDTMRYPHSTAKHGKNDDRSFEAA